MAEISCRQVQICPEGGSEAATAALSAIVD